MILLISYLSAKMFCWFIFHLCIHIIDTLTDGQHLIRLFSWLRAWNVALRREREITMRTVCLFFAPDVIWNSCSPLPKYEMTQPPETRLVATKHLIIISNNISHCYSQSASDMLSVQVSYSFVHRIIHKLDHIKFCLWLKDIHYVWYFFPGRIMHENRLCSGET